MLSVTSSGPFEVVETLLFRPGMMKDVDGAANRGCEDGAELSQQQEVKTFIDRGHREVASALVLTANAAKHLQAVNSMAMLSDEPTMMAPLVTFPKKETHLCVIRALSTLRSTALGVAALEPGSVDGTHDYDDPLLVGWYLLFVDQRQDTVGTA